MSGLADYLSKMLIGRGPLKREPSEKQMLNMARTRGGKTWKGAARDLGVSERTLRRWRQQGVPAAAAQRLRARTYEARMQSHRKGHTDDRAVQVAWTFDGRSRNTDGAHLKLADGTMRAVQDALMRGDAAAAAKAFVQGIGDPWYQDHFKAFQAQEMRHASAQAPAGEAGEEEGMTAAEASAEARPEEEDGWWYEYEEYPDAFQDADDYEFGVSSVL